MNPFNRTFKISISLTILVVLLAACGQRGPLYLPAPEQKPGQASEPTAGETEENESEDDGEKTSRAE